MLLAQISTGIITGTVTDESGTVIPKASVTITNKATNVSRVIAVNADGIFSAPSVEAGEYEVRATNPGFRTTVRDAQVTAGATATVNISLSIGTNTEVVNVEAATAQINYESNTVQGNIQRQTIQDLPLNGRSYQSSFGVQRDLGHEMVLTADWARRQGAHFNLEEDLDVDHFNAYANGVQQSIIPVRSLSQRYQPGQECVQGPINQWTPEGRSIYEGLLIKVQKRFSHRYQFQVSYALQNLNTDYIPYSSENYMLSYGPGLARHNLNITGSINLPWGFQLTMNSAILSRTPVEAVTTGVDITGTYEAPGSNGVLPGLGFNCLGITCGKSQLAAAVASWNSTYAGKASPNGTPNPAYVLPSDYEFDDPTFSQDFRLTKTFTYKERYRLLIFGEAFNAFNIANLTGYNFTLDAVNANPAAQTFTFGRPTQRAAQTFGSGGPRALQVGARITF
jgi:hypothetical protein